MGAGMPQSQKTKRERRKRRRGDQCVLQRTTGQVDIAD